MAEQKETPKERNLRQEAVSETMRLIIASFGLVAALAWNQFVQELINTSIKPFFGKDAGLISSLIYAVIVTILAVIITFFVSRFLKKD